MENNDNITSLTDSLTSKGFNVVAHSSENPVAVHAANIVFGITKPDVQTLCAHVETEADGTIVEAALQVLDENGEAYKGGDSILFLEESDCTDFDTIIQKLEVAFS